MQTLRAIFVLGAAAAGCFAQQWEFGAGGGGSFPTSVPVTAPGGSATAGLKPGAAFGAYLGQNLYSHVSGEIHYGFLMSDLCVKSGGQEADFSGQSHVLYYDVVLHTGGRGARKQVFVSMGGGMRVFRGTGTEAAYQPLMQYALLTKTQEVKPMGSVGVGIKLALAGLLGLASSGWYTILKSNLYSSLPGRSGTVLALGKGTGLFGKLLPFGIGLGPAMWILLAGPLALLIGLPGPPRVASGGPA